jgi:hypothetical protein
MIRPISWSTAFAPTGPRRGSQHCGCGVKFVHAPTMPEARITPVPVGIDDTCAGDTCPGDTTATTTTVNTTSTTKDDDENDVYDCN